MYRRKYLFIGLIIGMALGWILGFLRVPYFEKNISFGLGFIAALLLCLTTILWWSLTKSPLNANPTQDSPQYHFRSPLLLLVGVPALGGLVGGAAFMYQTRALRLHFDRQDKKLQEMTAAIQAANNGRLSTLLQHTLDDIQQELKSSPERKLSDSTIQSVASLSRLFEPYQYYKNDSLSETAYSPERGLLLKSLIFMKINPGSLAQIRKKVYFDGADLERADLKGSDLRGIHLQGANLKDADMEGANLDSAHLWKTCFWGANLNRATLDHADLKRADLRWSKINEASLVNTSMDGATLHNARLVKSRLHKVSLQWAFCEGVLLNGADLAGTNFKGTSLKRANLSNATLHGTDLRKADLSDADLFEARLDSTFVDENWTELLTRWRPGGWKYVQTNYLLVRDSTAKGAAPPYRLKKTL